MRWWKDGWWKDAHCFRLNAAQMLKVRLHKAMLEMSDVLTDSFKPTSEYEVSFLVQRSGLACWGLLNVTGVKLCAPKNSTCFVSLGGTNS
eukprot:scaffold191925_cov17-Tisochrysis_lutea.AAC.2